MNVPQDIRQQLYRLRIMSDAMDDTEVLRRAVEFYDEALTAQNSGLDVVLRDQKQINYDPYLHDVSLRA